MTRDIQLFPADEIGDALWALQEDGEDLSFEREVEFAVIFPDEQAAMEFAVMLLQNGQKVACSEYDGNDQLPWQVLAYPVMEPTHENISAYESLLAEHSEELGGKTDGWSAL
ncbi:ribonuclease E inhibitor RraB [Pseudomonas schmalbachii]|uniref:Ribonuclease E inhibitor RraB n=1 Tax=Pseudomonas schmalbachii TaxID=2816993 RepID=A0ABS3TJP9_9PSED|nr:ribonuclease E inhibitor RraB [Pseudomonas schmalbachii]MBO3273889.1 ribonuclease E inhibitor RraB [Pseudomonas schmalbachii]